MSSSFARSRRNTFSSLDIERDADWRSDDAAIRLRMRTADTRFLLLREDGRALIDAAGRALHALDRDAFERLRGDTDATTYLGRVQNRDWFVWHANDAVCTQIATLGDAAFRDLRAVGMALDADSAGLFAYARAIALWQQRTRYCCACGSPVRLESAGHRAVCTSSACAIEHFPRTDPAMIVVVTQADRCLLGRQASWPAGRYSALAGFVEPGETLEAAVRREVREEAGVHVVDCDYHSSQPWPFPSSIMLGFIARADDPTIRIGVELEDARWFTAAQIVDDLASGHLSMPSPLSVSYRLIEHWLRQTAGLELDAMTQADPLYRPVRG